MVLKTRELTIQVCSIMLVVGILEGVSIGTGPVDHTNPDNSKSSVSLWFSRLHGLSVTAVQLIMIYTYRSVLYSRDQKERRRVQLNWSQS